MESARRHYREAPKPLKAAVGDIQARFEVKVGHPAEQIVIDAAGHGIDHSVVGHPGHRLFERRLIGSVARRVSADAPCAVTVVRPRA